MIVPEVFALILPLGASGDAVLTPEELAQGDIFQ